MANERSNISNTFSEIIKITDKYNNGTSRRRVEVVIISHLRIGHTHYTNTHYLSYERRAIDNVPNI